MRKPNINEAFVIGFALYMFFTLMIDTGWMYESVSENPDGMYSMYLKFMGSQSNIAFFSLIVAFATMAILFTEKYFIRILINLIGLIYFTILAASYIFSYPNLGLGMSAILVIIMIININNLIDEQQEAKKRKIICDNYHDHSLEGGESNESR